MFSPKSVGNIIRSTLDKDPSLLFNMTTEYLKGVYYVSISLYKQPEDSKSEPYHIHDNVITINFAIEKHEIKLLNQILFNINSIMAKC